MAVVYHAHDPLFKREVAIKVLSHDLINEPENRARFEREAQAIAGLEHPAVVPVYDFGEAENHLYLVMRLMSHGSLADLLRQRVLTLDEAAHIVACIASALAEAHNQGIVHRDLKPGNILLDRFGNTFLSDFGIARLAEASAALTGTGMIGTPAYMSPEQIQGSHDVDGRTDIYSLGIILFEMLTGELPYQADTPPRLLMKHINEPIPDILAINAHLPGEIKRISAKALAKNPDARFSTAGELALALTAVVRA